jgi:hypothetical protein
MAPLKLLIGIASFANPLYKIAFSAVMFYSLYHRHQQFKAENERIRNRTRQNY